MKKSKLLLEPETIIRTKVDKECLDFFIRTWLDFCPNLQSLQEIAESVSNSFQIVCTTDDVIACYSLELEERDIKYQMSNLNLYQ